MNIEEYELTEENKMFLISELTKYYRSYKGGSILESLNKNKIGSLITKLVDPFGLLISENEHLAKNRVLNYNLSDEKLYQLLLDDKIVAIFTLVNGSENSKRYVHIPEIITLNTILSYDEAEYIYKNVIDFANDVAESNNVEFISIEVLNSSEVLSETVINDGYKKEVALFNSFEYVSSYKKERKRM